MCKSDCLFVLKLILNHHGFRTSNLLSTEATDRSPYPLSYIRLGSLHYELKLTTAKQLLSLRRKEETTDKNAPAQLKNSVPFKVDLEEWLGYVYTTLTHTHTYTHAHIHTHTHSHTHTNTRTHKHTDTQTKTWTHTDIHTHTH